MQVVLVGAAVLWGIAALVVVVARRHMIREGGVLAGAMMVLFRVYARVMHRVRFEGEERVPLGRASGDAQGVPRGADAPLIVVANHTAGIDPILIQAGLPFEVRWMMAEDMRVGWMQPLWDLGRIIFVDRENGDSRSLREALRHLKQGGALGVFPEGAIERAPRRIKPFKDGVGFLIKKSGAAVLPVVVEGTPSTATAWGSIWRRSHATVRFLPVRDLAGCDGDAAAITRALERLFLEETGWAKAGDGPDRLVGA